MAGHPVCARLARSLVPIGLFLLVWVSRSRLQRPGWANKERAQARAKQCDCRCVVQ